MQNTVDSASIPTVNNITNYMGYTSSTSLPAVFPGAKTGNILACRLPPSVGTAVWTSVGWWTLSKRSSATR